MQIGARRETSPHKKVVVLKVSDKGYWVYQLNDVENGLTYWGMPAVHNQPNAAIVLIAKALAHTGLTRNLFKLQHKAFLAPLMGPSERRLFPTCYAYESIVHCFDCWPPEYDRWERIFRRHRVETAFFSARQSAEHFQERLPGMTSLRLPEAVDPSNYVAAVPLGERCTDVLELGRSYDRYHEAITPTLASSGAVHHYSEGPRALIFPLREELARGLSNSKISVCFPSSITHPERSGSVETVTYRYFESIASNCLVLGSCPSELIDLFGYNPCVEADFSRPSEQIEELLHDIGSWQSFVDHNYERLLQVGTYETRARQLLDALARRGYDVPLEAGPTHLR